MAPKLARFEEGPAGLHLIIRTPRLHAADKNLPTLLKIVTVEEPTFTLFPTFPPELRRMVWACALPDKHVIELQSPEMIPRARETITIMEVSREARQVALKAYNLVDLVELGSSITTNPFYFSPSRSICVLNDEASTLQLHPLLSDDQSHPWNLFREQITTLAVDPLLYFKPGPDIMPGRDPMIYASACQALKITIAVCTMPGLEKLIILRKAGHEQYLRVMV